MTVTTLRHLKVSYFLIDLVLHGVFYSARAWAWSSGNPIRGLLGVRGIEWVGLSMNGILLRNSPPES